MGETAVVTAGDGDVVENFEVSSPARGQFLPSAMGGDDGTGSTDGAGGGEGCAVGTSDDPVASLRSDLQRLRDSVDEIDRRDAAQHGGLKGEIAHLVRRIARLEAIPRPRPVR